MMHTKEDSSFCYSLRGQGETLQQNPKLVLSYYIFSSTNAVFARGASVHAYAKYACVLRVHM